MHLVNVISLLIRLVSLLTLTMLVPTAVAIYYENTINTAIFASCTAVGAFFGVGLLLTIRGATGSSSRRESILLMVPAWCILPLVAAMPFFFYFEFTRFPEALFEAVAGLTTTGATVFLLPEMLPKSIVVWRAILQWLGGLGTIVAGLAILPSLGVGGLRVVDQVIPHAEGDNLAMRIWGVTVAVFWIYGGITLLCMIALTIGDLSPLEAFCVALSTVSTGGFSPNSNGPWMQNDGYIQMCLIVFMLLGALNFGRHWQYIAGRKALGHRDDPETRYLLGGTAAAAVLIGIAFALGERENGFLTNVITGFFNAASALTTTGYWSNEPASFGFFLLLLLACLSMIGGATGSTAGGLKQMRIGILLKQARIEWTRLIFPHGMRKLHYGEKIADISMITSIWALFVSMLIFLAGAIAGLCLSGMDFSAATISAMLAISNSGPGPVNYAGLGTSAQLILSATMIAGRVEILAMFAFFSSAFWRL